MTKCKEIGRSLASIQNQEENSIIKALINGKNKDFWIGINDISSEGTFKWSDGSALHFTDWATGEPNNANGGDCGQLQALKNFKWDDDVCNAHKRYICGPGKLHFETKFK